MTSPYQLELPAHDPESAPAEARANLEQAQATFGFVPNMYARMANLPGLLATYIDGYRRFREEADFTPAEQEVVFLTVSARHGCDYCMAAHSTLADLMSGVPAPVTEAIRQGQPIPDPKLAALSAFVDAMVETRGEPSQAAVRAFLDAGYDERHVLGVILAIAVKTMSNYANHLFHTPLDPMFQERAWTPAG